MAKPNLTERPDLLANCSAALATLTNKIVDEIESTPQPPERLWLEAEVCERLLGVVIEVMNAREEAAR
jgi:hypothetical protein